MKSLNFNKVCFSYNRNAPIFKDLDMSINADRGHIIALMGASGSGKSTLFKLILQNEKPQKGKIEFNTINPIISYLPQEPVLFEHLSPIQNARYFQRSSYYKKYFNEKLFVELIKALNFQDALNNSKSVLKLSGGQRQRLSLLRALSIQPDILLLDEPTTGLDATVKLQFLNKLREIVMKYGFLVFYITHNKLETELIADEVIYLFTKNNSFANVYRNDLLNFIKQPPILEAFEVFAYPKPNILCGKIENNFLIPVTSIDVKDAFYFGVSENNILFSDSGLKFDIVARNPINTIIKIEDNEQNITLSTEKIESNSSNYITLMGTFNTYNVEGDYLKKIEIYK